MYYQIIKLLIDLILCFFSKIFQYFAISPSRALGCYWLYRKPIRVTVHSDLSSDELLSSYMQWIAVNWEITQFLMKTRYLILLITNTITNTCAPSKNYPVAPLVSRPVDTIPMSWYPESNVRDSVSRWLIKFLRIQKICFHNLSFFLVIIIDFNRVVYVLRAFNSQ